MPRNPQWMLKVAAQAHESAASAMDGRSAIIGRLRSSGAPSTPSARFVTCNGKTEITESVQIVLDPIFDVESDGDIHF